MNLLNRGDRPTGHTCSALSGASILCCPGRWGPRGYAQRTNPIMLRRPVPLQAGARTHENANKTSTGSPHWERHCMRGHSSCLHWRGKDLDYLRASFHQIQLTSYLHSLLLPSVFSFCRVGVKKTDLFGGLHTKLDMDCIYVFDGVAWFLFKTAVSAKKKKFLKR